MKKEKIIKKEIGIQTEGLNIDIQKPDVPSIDIQVQKLKENIKINYIYYIVTAGCLYALSQSKASNKSLLCIVITYIIISAMGYFSHYISHHIQFGEVYKHNSTILRSMPIIDKYILKIFNIVDFHRVVHHNSEYENDNDIVSINKKFKNIIYEFCHNFITQGLGIIIFSKLLNYLDISAIFVWCIFYATAHNINYNITSPTCHIDHHKNDRTNYGIDIYDIIFGTKYDWNDLENYNHYAINMIIITVLIIWLSNYLYK